MEYILRIDAARMGLIHIDFGIDPDKIIMPDFPLKPPFHVNCRCKSGLPHDGDEH